MKHYEFEINQFVDNELPEDEQQKLFSHLAVCNECCELLSGYLKIKSETKSYYEKLEVAKGPSPVIQNNGALEKKRSYKYPFYFSAAAAIILGFLFLMQFNSRNKIDKKYSKLSYEFTSLKKDYNLLVNSSSNDVKEVKEKFEIMEKEKQTVRSKEKPINPKDVAERIPFIQKDNKVKNHPDVVNVQTVMTQFTKEELSKGNLQKYKVRDLFQRKTPYKNDEGAIVVDTAIIRDLFLREGKDKFYTLPLQKGKDIVMIPKEEKTSKYLDYINALPTEKITKEDFLTPQIIGN